MQTWISGPDSKFCTVPCILQNSDSDSVIDYVERSVSAVSYSTPSIRPISRKSTHPDITLKLPKILESRGREVEEGGSKLQYLDHYYHLISHRSKSSLSKTAKLTWKDTDSDTLSTGLPSWVMSATQEFKVHVTMHSHWKWKNPIKTSHFTECPWNTGFFLLDCCVKLNWLCCITHACILIQIQEHSKDVAVLHQLIIKAPNRKKNPPVLVLSISGGGVCWVHM